MKTLQTDLFPETMIVSREGKRIFTTSLKVAEHFHKRHTHVLDSVQKVIADLADDAFSQPNFRLAEYLDGQKKPRPMYELSHDGFALLAMGFTGKEAMLWKKNFLAAFREMERQLFEHTERIANAFAIIRPTTLTVAFGTVAGLSRSAIAEPLGKSANAITYHRRKARQLGLL